MNYTDMICELVPADKWESTTDWGTIEALLDASGRSLRHEDGVALSGFTWKGQTFVICLDNEDGTFCGVSVAKEDAKAAGVSARWAHCPDIVGVCREAWAALQAAPEALSI